MMKKLKFYRNQGWWVDLPEYIEQGGDPADLAMVCGADDFLDHLSGGTDEVRLEVNNKKVMSFPGDFSMLRRCDEIPTVSGSYYFDDATDSLMWLCDVTRWVFEGRFPETIWYKKI